MNGDLFTYYAVQHQWDPVRQSPERGEEWVFSNHDGLPHTEPERSEMARCRSATGRDGFLDQGPGRRYVARLNRIARQPGNKTPDHLVGLLKRRFRLVRVHDIRIVDTV